MKLLKKPNPWIRMALARIAFASYFMFYMLMSFMQVK